MADDVTEEDLLKMSSGGQKNKQEPSAAIPLKHIKVAEEEKESEVKKEEKPAAETSANEPPIFALRTTANREEQVLDFLSSNAAKKKIPIYAVIKPHGMRGYIFVEAASKQDLEQAISGIPYVHGLLPKTLAYKEIEHMLEQVKYEVDIRKNDIAEIISGPFKREKCKITRVDKVKEEVVVELLESAVPIPITVKMDAVKVIRRDSDDKVSEE
ncbi:MAG TPA: transcription elongation factor Spt5 [Candidatus Nanoarchaeia archaeon]|nr:transcription elongation factor Spt5 [Candidatus Nanoarchaeia archaeon]